MQTEMGAITAQRGRSYFFACAVVFLAAVIAGFGPTFFFRLWFQEEALPIYLVLHGVVLAVSDADLPRLSQ